MPNKPITYSSRRTIIDFNKVGLGGSVLHLGRYNLHHADRGLEEHVHWGAMEICYLAKGRQTYRVAERDYILGGNDVFITFPDERHGTGNHPEEKGILYWLLLLIPPKGETFLGFPQDSTKALQERIIGIPRRCFATSSEVRKLLDTIFTAYFQVSKALRPIVMATKLVELLVLISDFAYNDVKKTRYEDINSVLRFIDSHPEISMSVPQLADQFHISESWFKAKFRSHVGIPPGEYILRSKIERSKEMLQSGNNTITEIAFRLGFSSSGYFATVFKRFTNKNPRDFLPGGIESL
jgi:AraC-like DNA-binding protein